MHMQLLVTRNALLSPQMAKYYNNIMWVGDILILFF